jgi:hypothetical protein
LRINTVPGDGDLMLYTGFLKGLFWIAEQPVMTIHSISADKGEQSRRLRLFFENIRRNEKSEDGRDRRVIFVFPLSTTNVFLELPFCFTKIMRTSSNEGSASKILARNSQIHVRIKLQDKTGSSLRNIPEMIKEQNIGVREQNIVVRF